jgi:hypothetical protein
MKLCSNEGDDVFKSQIHENSENAPQVVVLCRIISYVANVNVLQLE